MRLSAAEIYRAESYMLRSRPDRTCDLGEIHDSLNAFKKVRNDGIGGANVEAKMTTNLEITSSQCCREQSIDLSRRIQQISHRPCGYKGSSLQRRLNRPCRRRISEDSTTAMLQPLGGEKAEKF